MKQQNASSGDPAEQRTVIALKGQEIFVQRGMQAAVPLLGERGFAIDITDEARCHIAFKIARLLPDIVESQKAELLAYTVRVLQVLCRDQLLRVREILSEEMKDYPFAPHDVMFSLAQDRADSVALPVLECSPVLSDQDLVEIIKHYGREEVLLAIARRKRLSSLVTDALVACQSIPVLRRLLGNSGAQYGENALEQAVEMAREHESLHEPLLRLPNLPQRVLNRLAEFVSKSLLERLTREGLMPGGMQQELAGKIQQRLASPSKDSQRKAIARAAELAESGRLDHENIEEALLGGNRALVKAALIQLSGFNDDAVERILRSGNASAITALCWKAGLPMRLAMQVQLRLGQVDHRRMLRARGGTEYPMSAEDMEGFLDIFRD